MRSENTVWWNVTLCFIPIKNIDFQSVSALVCQSGLYVGEMPLKLKSFHFEWVCSRQPWLELPSTKINRFFWWIFYYLEMKTTGKLKQYCVLRINVPRTALHATGLHDNPFESYSSIAFDTFNFGCMWGKYSTEACRMLFYTSTQTHTQWTIKRHILFRN